jgi:opacity protein-like surface antigen
MFHIQHPEKYLYTFLLCLFLFIPFSVFAVETAPLPDSTLASEQQNTAIPLKSNIWSSGVGEGFRKGTKVLGASAGASYDLRLGSEEQHNLALLSVTYGRMIGNVKGEGKWYRGNWEHVMELFGGAEVNVKNRGIVGLTTHVRYNFATGTRFIPYADIGFGVTLTEIREPDLGDAFQFNEQGNIGANYFVQDNMSINFFIQWLHISSGGLSEPNKSVNPVGCYLGVNWFF